MKFFKLAKKEIRLNRAEKEDIRSLILKTIKNQPVRVGGQIRHKYQRNHPWYLLLTPNYMMASIIAAVLLVLGGGASYAAENSLPGDLLYPVKVTVNENVRTALSLSETGKVKWEAKVAERRLEEAEQLAVQGKLSEDMVSELEEKFDKQSEKVQKRLARLLKKGALSSEALIELNSNFQASLEAHNSILLRLREQDGESEKARYTNLLKLLADNVSSTARARLKIEHDFDDDEFTSSTTSTVTVASTSLFVNAAMGKKTAAENKLREVKQFYQAKSTSLDAALKAKVNAKLAEADKIMVEGDAKLAARKYGEAFAKYQEAARKAQEAKLLIDISQKIKIKWLPVTVSSTLPMASGTLNLKGVIQLKDGAKKKEDEKQSKDKAEAERDKSGQNIKVQVKGVIEVEDD